jgi:hypothetical protein
VLVLHSERRELTIGNVESKGTQAADEARRRSATARGFRRRKGGKEEQGGDVGAEGERDTERRPREIPKRTHLIDTNGVLSERTRVAAAAAASATERSAAREGQRQDKREGEPSRGRGRWQMERRGGGEDGE